MKQPRGPTGRHPLYKDMTGKTVGVLRVERETTGECGQTRWVCTCTVCGATLRLRGLDLRRKQSSDRCSSKCGKPQAAPAGELAEFARPAPLDLERNRERYVRLKLQLRSVGLEPEPFAALTCAECPVAPTCKSAFDSYNVDGDCLESK